MNQTSSATQFQLELEQLVPFGVVVRNQDSSLEPARNSLNSVPVDQIFDLVRAHKVVVFRGFEMFAKQELALFAQKLGKPLQWSFGAINELVVKPKTENYLFTDHAVPLHWDGAFVGSIPHIILFQCITAPKPQDRGGTTFCDTSRVLTSVPPKKLAEWKQVSIKYSTEKIVHYGGNITQQLVLEHESECDEHETEPRAVMRYAEPVDDLNPVTLEIRGAGSDQDVFIQEMQDVLYDPANLLVHRWQAGDVVLADNHVLLHGREAFSNPSDRHIQRINILHRPKNPDVKRFLQNCLTIRRKEFFIAELPIFLIPLLLNLTSMSAITRPWLYVGLLAVLLLFNLGDMINCYEDYELDSIYKSHLSNAVFELGKRNVKRQIIVSGALGVLLTVVVSLATHRLYLIPTTLFGCFAGLQYSMKPFKFKSRGLLQVLCLWGIIFFGPMLYAAIVANGFPPILQLTMFALYGVHQMGIVMLNTAEDYVEDKASGLNTVVIRLGLHRALNIAFRMVVGSGMGLSVATAAYFRTQQAQWYVYLPILVFVLGWQKVVAEYKVVISKINSENEMEAIEVIKKNGMKVPRWLKIGAYSYLFSLVLFFIQNIHG
jgi:alpha-ketoglutarate-dependent taurine dioxygenase/4-hydroxybenzoate polyprenyltransferase